MSLVQGSAVPGAPARNGLPEKPYAYRGTGADMLTGSPRQRRPRTRVPLAARVTAVLEDLGGEASTPQIRKALELDGGPPLSPGYIAKVLLGMSMQEPAAVTMAGRDNGGSGRPMLWRLAGLAAPAPAQGHKDTCGGAT